MKKINTWALTMLIIAVVVCGVVYASLNETPVSKGEFEAYKAEFEAKISTLQNSIDNIDSDIDTLKSNVDTLKIGQRVIYEEVKKNNETFYDKILNLWN